MITVQSVRETELSWPDCGKQQQSTFLMSMGRWFHKLGPTTEKALEEKVDPDRGSTSCRPPLKRSALVRRRGWSSRLRQTSATSWWNGHCIPRISAEFLVCGLFYKYTFPRINIFLLHNVCADDPHIRGRKRWHSHVTVYLVTVIGARPGYAYAIA